MNKSKNNKLIFIPFAFDNNKNSGVNISSNQKLNVYCKNFCVALVSLKKYNSDSDVALVTNVELPNIYKDLLLNNNIIIYKENYDEFSFSNEYPWSLAFYKLCALKKMLSKNYAYYCYLDADIIAQNSFDNIWNECDNNILLYDINHGLQVNDYQIFIDEVNAFGINSYITHFGGEFFAASKENAKIFITECTNIYNDMIEKNFITTRGDEFILSVAAFKLKNKIKNAGAYIFRFWTGIFYLVSTSYKFNSITILHLPSEKEFGILKIYNNYILKNKYPSKEKIWKICHISKKNTILNIKYNIKKYLKRH